MRWLASPICRSKGSPNCYHGTGNPPRLIPPLSGQHDRSCSPLAKAMSPRPSAHAYREAIRELVKQNLEIRECLERYVARPQRNDAAYMAAFYADAAPLARKLDWRGGDELEALGTEADLLKVGVSPMGSPHCFRSFGRTSSVSTRFALTPSARNRALSTSRPPSWPTGRGRHGRSPLR